METSGDEEYTTLSKKEKRLVTAREGVGVSECRENT